MSEGSIYQRKDGRWVAKWKDINGKWKYLYRKTRFEDGYPHIHLVPGYETPEEQQTKREAAVQILWITALVLQEAYEQVIKDISQIALEEQGATYRGRKVASYRPEA